MQLKKRNTQTENDNGLVGTIEYQWTDMTNKPVSDWMNFDNALIWIKEHDESKETS
jgi:hypothetical protein